MNNFKKWYQESGLENTIVIDSKATLRRNFKDFPFVPLSNVDEKEILLNYMEKNILSNGVLKEDYGFNFFVLNSIPNLQRAMLFEEQIITRDSLKDTNGIGFFISEKSSANILINESDHIIITAINSGLSLDEAYCEVFKVEEALEAVGEMLYDEEYGYLCTKKRYVGTGLTLSVLLNIPGILFTDRFNNFKEMVDLENYEIKGYFSDENGINGVIYEISTKVALGQSEAEMLEDFKTLLEEIIALEKSSRDLLRKGGGAEHKDMIFRAYGILNYSYTISDKEFLKLLSLLRLGVYYSYDLLDGITLETLNTLFITGQNGGVQNYYGREMLLEEINLKRSSMLQEILTKEEKEYLC